MKYRVPSVPLALSSLRDRAAPVDSTYSRISLRFWYDGVSRDLCKMVRSSPGSFSAWSTLYLTRAQPWRAGGPLGATLPLPSRFLFRGLRSGGRSQDRRGPSYLTDAFPMYFSSERASEWRNERLLLPTQMFRSSFILRNSCSKLDNVAAWCTTKIVWIRLFNWDFAIVTSITNVSLFCELTSSREQLKKE